MKILVRLPNWLGDMVMSVGFIHALQKLYPGAEISVIAKKGIDGLLPFFPLTSHQFIFDKSTYKGLPGLYSFGRTIRSRDHFDLFFCLPDSFSSAFMGLATGAQKRVGYRKELREIMLTDSFIKPSGMHRVEEYIFLLEKYTGKSSGHPHIKLHHPFPKQDYIAVNINSEASSRRLTKQKAISLINLLRKETEKKLVLVGSPKEKEFVDAVYHNLVDRHRIENAAGKTSLPELASVLASARAMLSTDSGPAHLANALGTPVVVLFGAGREANTAPYNKEFRTIVRLGQLSCEPCEKNICTRYGIPQCLEKLSETSIIQQLVEHL